MKGSERKQRDRVKDIWRKVKKEGCEEKKNSRMKMKRKRMTSNGALRKFDKKGKERNLTKMKKDNRNDKENKKKREVRNGNHST